MTAVVNLLSMAAMKHLLLAAAALSLAACATVAPEPAPQAPVGPATQENWEAGQAAYLEWNGARRDWSTTESGLQYRRVGEAKPDARQPSGGDIVRVHYRGTFIDGREFDSSYSRGQPTEFPLNRVIRGWTEGLALMRDGETFEFVIPGDLAYGPRWVSGKIPPNSVLIFQVELIESRATNP